MVKKLDIVTVKTCKDPGTPRNGRRNESLQVGETLHFSCAHCYQLKGSSTRTCLSDLTWSGRQPVCTGKFCCRLSVSLEFDWFQERMNLLKIGGPMTPTRPHRWGEICRPKDVGNCIVRS
jgi:hypothetical protein